eukprot:SAG31_NODE_1441_length_8327_cov_10.972941_2_plen_1452_part_00
MKSVEASQTLDDAKKAVERYRAVDAEAPWRDTKPFTEAIGAAKFEVQLATLSGSDQRLLHALGVTDSDRRQARLQHLCDRMVSNATLSILSELPMTARATGTVATEAHATHLIEQALALRDAASSKNLKNMKRKAFTGLLRRLKLFGLRPAFAGALPLSGCLSAAKGVSTNALPDDDTGHRTRKAWVRADKYFYRCIFTLQKLRRLSTAFSQDITSSEAAKLSGCNEHLLTILVQQRNNAAEFSVAMKRLVFGLDRLAVLGASIFANHESEQKIPNGQSADSPARPGTCAAMLQKQKEKYDRIVSLAAHTQINLQATQSARKINHPEVMEMLCKVAAHACNTKQLIDGCLEQYRAAAYHSYDSLMANELSRAVRVSSDNAASLQSIIEDGPQIPNMVACFELRAATTTLMALSSDAHVLKNENLKDLPGGLIDNCGASKRPASNIAASQFCENFSNLYESIIEELLLSIQSLCKMSSAWEADAAEIQEEENKKLLTKQHWHFSDLLKAARLPSIHAKLRTLCDALSTASIVLDLDDSDSVLSLRLAFQMLVCMRPMLVILQTVMSSILQSYIAYHSSVSKLLFVLLNVSTEIMEKGFCTPPDEEEDGEADGVDDDIAGTGMAEGQGKKDVSEEIEDEEQLLGLQGEQQEEDQQDGEKSEGKEMENDFDGEMVDRQRDSEGDDDDSAEEEQEDLDREMDDGEQEQVDEKMWGDVESMDDDKDDDKEENFDSAQDAVEKTGQLQGQDDKKDEPMSDKQPQSQPPEEEEVDMPDPDEAVPEVDGDPASQEEEQEQNFPDQVKPNDLELPDDMAISDDNDGSDDENNDGDQDNNDVDEAAEGQDDQGDRDAPDDAKPDEHDVQQEDEKNDAANEQSDREDIHSDGDDGDERDDRDDRDGDDSQQNDNAEENDQTSETKMDVDEENEEGRNEAGSSSEDDDAVPHNDEDGDRDDRKHEGEEDQKDSEEKESDPATSNSKPPSMTQKNEHTVMSETPKTGDDSSAVIDQQRQAGGGSDEPTGDADENSADNSTQAAPSGQQFSDSAVPPSDQEQQASSDQPQQMEAARSNPLDNLVNAMQEWCERRNMVQTDAATEMEEAGADDAAEKNDTAENYRYLENDSELHDDGMALAPSQGEQNMQQPDTKEDAEDGDTNAIDDPADKPTDDEPADSTKAPKLDGDQTLSQTAADPLANDGGEREVTHASSDEEDENGQPEQVDQVDGIKIRTEDAEIEMQHSEHARIIGASAFEAVVEQDADESREMMLDPAENDEVQRDEVRRLDQGLHWWDGDISVDEIWRTFDQISERPAEELCEQLRRILEPTKASKMKGGYATGKRINMRAVIPYIASDFKKDKIWLRRTQPDRRNYQIIIAIDDTLSMRENRSGQLCVEALLVLCKALARLEAGQVCVVRFGSTADVVLPFERPYTADVGPEVCCQFCDLGCLVVCARLSCTWPN